MIGVSLLVFPKLALGMSGFETGVAVMPHVERRPDRHRGAAGRPDPRHQAAAHHGRGDHERLPGHQQLRHHPADPAERSSSPAARANGRALAYLAHEYLGNGFGTVYDVSTIAILWFAGASAMAGLLNLIPRYLPRYGMAPDWAGAVRPLVLVLTGTAFLVTWIFDADVDAPGRRLRDRRAGAVHQRRRRGDPGRPPGRAAQADGRLRRRSSLVFVYTTVDNVVERPDGVKIGACFIAGHPRSSRCLAAGRVFELRATEVELDATARCSSATAPAARSGSSPTRPDAPRRRGVRRQDPADPRRPRPARRPRRDLRRGDRGRPVRLRGPARRARRGAARRATGC